MFGKGNSGGRGKREFASDLGKAESADGNGRNGRDCLVAVWIGIRREKHDVFR